MSAAQVLQNTDYFYLCSTKFPFLSKWGKDLLWWERGLTTSCLLLWESWAPKATEEHYCYYILDWLQGTYVLLNGKWQWKSSVHKRMQHRLIPGPASTSASTVAGLQALVRTTKILSRMEPGTALCLQLEQAAWPLSCELLQMKVLHSQATHCVRRVCWPGDNRQTAL